MLDLFPFVYATLKAANYFTTDLEGFLDNQGNFKVYKRNSAPNADSPFVTVEIQPGPQDQRSEMVDPFVLFNVWGQDTQWEDLYAIAGGILGVFRATNTFAVVDATTLDYELIGKPVFDEGENPVTGQVVVSVALRFAFAAA